MTRCCTLAALAKEVNGRECAQLARSGQCHLAVCQRLGATVAFEAVAGDMTGMILNALGPHACVYVYRALTEEACGGINPIDLIFHGKTVTGFYLGNWLREQGIARVLRAALRLQKLLIAGKIETHVGRTVDLDGVVDGLLDYVGAMTVGKTLIMPHGK